MQTEGRRPACAGWKLWHGQEIEGNACLGERTLFIRDPGGFTAEYLKQLYPGIDRVWFCYEFYTWVPKQEHAFAFMRRCLELYREVCVEMRGYEIPADIAAKARLYHKLNLNVKPGDHICVGSLFNDEAFEIGSGKKVHPAAYNADVKIL